VTELTILIPVLNRPHRVRPVLDSALAATPDADVLFIADPGDHVEIEELSRQGADWITVDGGYAKKINEGVRRTSSPFVFSGADDLLFHPNWFEAAKSEMSDTVGCVGTQDLCNRRVLRGEHATHFLFARWYCELGTIDGQDGPVFEGYQHEYLDDEIVKTAKFRGAWAFANDSVVEHLHPDAGKAPSDDLYAARPRRMKQGARLHRERAHLWT